MSYGAIFDLDGLLIDSEPLHKQAEKEMFNWLQVNGEKASELTYGMKFEDAYLIFQEKLRIKKPLEEVRNFWFARIKALFEAGVELMPGAEKAIGELDKAGFKLGLASSSPRALIDIFLKQQPFDFSAIVTGDEVEKGKPDPEIYLLAARKLNLNPAFCLAVEDAPRGVEAAKNAGMKCFAVPNLYTKGFDFSRADKILNSLKELTPELAREFLS